MNLKKFEAKSGIIENTIIAFSYFKKHNFIDFE